MVLYDSTLVSRNAETVMKLVATGMISPEDQPPASLYHDPSSIYSRWFSSLPKQVKSVVLPHLSECNLPEKLKEVGKGWGWGPRVPLKAPSAPGTSALLRCL